MSTDIEKMRGYIDFARDTVESITTVRDSLYSTKKTEWLNSLREAAIDLSGDAQMVFIGEFSSGKSTFVNALLGTNILPTASKPCTSVVTEVQLVSDGLGHRGKIVYLGDIASEELEYDEIIKLIDGSTGVIGKMASIHHVELKYDISNLSNNASPLTFLERAKIKLIDTPGFNSPYGMNEDVVMEYLEKSKYSFWFFPSDKIGGSLSKKLIEGIKKRGIEIIPIITKSDKIKNVEDKDEIKDRFSDYFSSNLMMKEPRFVSAYKAIEATEKSKKNSDQNSTIASEIERLNLESGFEAVARDLLLKSTDKVISSEKLKTASVHLNILFIDLIKSSLNECAYWKKQLSLKGWVEDDKYKKIDDIKKELTQYSKFEALDIAKEFEGALSDKVLRALQKKKSRSALNEDIIKIIDQLKTEIFTIRLQQVHGYIIDKFRSSFDTARNSFNVEIDTPEFSRFEEYTNPIFAIMDSLKFAGPNAIMTGGGGLVMFLMAGTMAQIPFIGGALAAVATTMSAGLLLVALIPLIPAMVDSNRQRSEKAKLQANIQIRDWIRTVKIEHAIQTSIKNIINEVHNKLRGKVDDDLKLILGNYEDAVSTYDALVNKQQEFKIVFGIRS